jgi:hypothetical protein
MPYLSSPCGQATPEMALHLEWSELQREKTTVDSAKFELQRDDRICSNLKKFFNSGGNYYESDNIFRIQSQNL